MSQSWVAILMLCITVMIVLFDIVLALDSQKANTISAVSRRIGKLWPPTRIIVPFACGVIVGHIWWT